MADEYPSNVYPWFGLQRFGVETRLLARPGARFGADDIAPLIDRRTRVLAVSAVDWQSGFRVDLAALAELCRAREVLFVVDGIQAVGALCVDVGACGVDVLAAGGHKWLLAPEGCGMLFVSDRVVERIYPVVLGWKSVRNAGVYLPYHFELRADAARLEPGSAPHLGIHAFGAALDLLLEIGPAAIEARGARHDRPAIEGLGSTRRHHPESGRARGALGHPHLRAGRYRCLARRADRGRRHRPTTPWRHPPGAALL